MRNGDDGCGDSVFEFGVLVRRYRHAAGLTQLELADKAGISVAALRDFEQSRRHRPRPGTLATLARALDLDPDETAGFTRAAASRHRPEGPGIRPWRAGSAGTPAPPKLSQGLWLAVLGPLEAWKDGTSLPLGPPARRTVLGLLLMEPGVLVRRDTIIDVLWGEEPPRTAVGLVQAHVSRIRRLLDPRNGDVSGDEVISSIRSAYRLRVPCEQLDLLVFRDLAARAAAAWVSGDQATAIECYDQAVGLWRGDPLADLEELNGYPGVAALSQELVGVLLRYAEVACAAGLHFRVLPRLRALADADPLNEPAHARLMIALAGCGQQAAAIRVYEGVRSRLDRELGLYPGEELAEAYLRVLRQDIRSGKTGRVPISRLASADGAHVVPRQLPAGPRNFTGRAGELAALSALLEREPGQASGVVIAALTGMAGIGKTALAVHWAHRVASQFPDGQLFINLRGFGPSGAAVTATEAVRGFLVALGVAPARIPADRDGQAGLFRSLLVGRRMLIVLDNAQDAAQVRPLLPGSPGCLVLVTSRNRLTGLAAAEGAHLLNLGGLTAAESRDLLRASVGAERAMAEPVAVSELIGVCACLPLALCDVAARAVASPGLPLAALAAEMRDTPGRLDALETGESATSVRMVFSWSRARLREPASRMFRMLGIHPGPDIAVPAAASLTGMPREQAYLALAELRDEHLLTEYAPGRYNLHELLRAYAAERARTSDSDAERRAAVHRVLDYYLHAATAASSFICPDRTQLTLSRPRPGVVLGEITGSGQAAEWFENERYALLAAIGQAVEGEYSPHAWELPWAAGWFFQDEACWQLLAAAQESALAIAVRLGDLAGQVLIREHLGSLRFLLGDIVGAGHHLDEAVKLATRLGDERLRALTGLSRAYVLQSQGRAFEAMAQAKHALRLYHAAGDRKGESRALYTIGWYLFQLGDYKQAAGFSSRALMADRESFCAADR
jgi:DNA-binding SARP family transcriptional activator/tetratricopeptide (TPR) repeat protein/DNA-binding XRE family transcriptional regulator